MTTLLTPPKLTDNEICEACGIDGFDTPLLDALSKLQSALTAKWLEMLAGQEACAWGLFVRVEDGSWQLQHPVRFTQEDAQSDISMYERTNQFDVRQLYAAPVPAQAPMTDERTVSLIKECLGALAEELGAWDIDPPLHHVKQAHDKCAQWLAHHNITQEPK